MFIFLPSCLMMFNDVCIGVHVNTLSVFCQKLFRKTKIPRQESSTILAQLLVWLMMQNKPKSQVLTVKTTNSLGTIKNIYLKQHNRNSIQSKSELCRLTLIYVH